MGMNFYHKTNICKCCNRYDEKHIGKSSHGWQFNFQGHNYPPIRSFKDWKRELKADGKIFDEEGKEISFEDFVKKVESKQSEPNNHYDHCKKEGYDIHDDWKDSEGYSFTYSEFS